MKLSMLRKMYRFLYWLGQQGRESKFIYGFYNRYPHPSTVPDSDLYNEINRLGKDIEQAD